MKALDPRAALHRIMELVYSTNKFLFDAAPWNLAKMEDAASREYLDQVIFTSTEAIRVTCILLQPFMPDKMAQALDDLGVLPENRTFQFAQFGADTAYGEGITEREIARTQNKKAMKGAKRKERALEGLIFPPLNSEF